MACTYETMPREVTTTYSTCLNNVYTGAQTGSNKKSDGTHQEAADYKTQEPRQKGIV